MNLYTAKKLLKPGVLIRLNKTVVVADRSTYSELSEFTVKEVYRGVEDKYFLVYVEEHSDFFYYHEVDIIDEIVE